MPEQPNRVQVQEYRFSFAAHVFDGGTGRLIRIDHITAVTGHIRKTGTAGHGGLNPAVGGWDRNPEPIVLTDE